MHEQLTAVNAEKASLQQQLATAHRTLQAQNANADQLVAEVTAVKAALSEEQRKAVAAVGEAGSVEAEKDALQQSLKQAQAALAAEQAKAASHSMQLVAANERLQELPVLHRMLADSKQVSFGVFVTEALASWTCACCHKTCWHPSQQDTQ